MKRLTLALTAATALSCAAVAQTTAPAQNPPTSAPATQPQQRSTDAAHPMFQMKQGEWRTSKLIGLNVYNNDDKIGDINELIVGKDGKIDAVVIGVGGFLGMGEHDVAVPFEKVKFLEEPRRTAAARTDDRTARTDARPAGTAPAAGTTAERRDAATTGTVATTPPARDGAARTDTYRGYPDHAEVAMTKDQLKALPQVRYSR
jgi:sporulation protein YlmC with PRC-barrel domain